MRTNHTIKTILLGALVTMLSLSSIVIADMVAETKMTKKDTKDLQIRLRDSAVQSEALKVGLTPLKSSFKVNEAVQFKVHGNQDFFMYLFTMDEKNNQAALILPNTLQKGNKYPAKQTLIVPNKSVEFFSDAPGTEKVIMVASKKYFNWDTKGYTAAGKFLVTDVASVKTQLKRLNVRPAAQATATIRRDNDIYVQEVTFNITGNASQQPSTSALTQQVANALTGTTNIVESSIESATGITRLNDTIAFINTDKTSYAKGEKISLIYGANKAGWVHVISFDGATVTQHSSTQVNGQTIHQLSAAATAPKGQTNIAAIYTSTNKAPKTDQIKAMFSSSVKKGLSITRKEKHVYAIKTISVK